MKISDSLGLSLAFILKRYARDTETWPRFLSTFWCYETSEYDVTYPSVAEGANAYD